VSTKEPRFCTVDGCEKPLCSRGLCVNHYRIRRKSGELPLLERKQPKPCKAEGCELPQLARGWCSSHYARWRHTGDARESEPLSAVDGFTRCARCQRNKENAQFASGNTWCKRCVTTHEANRRDGRTCSGCDAVITVGSASGLCVTCFGMSRRATAPAKYRTGNGYIQLSAHWDHPNASERGRILEHVKVMSDTLGRPLLPGENVHHKNGVRDDNRPENLELWVTSQPSGQRPDDLVAWAYEILERYAPQQFSA
jgi:hypothetical protein